MRVVIEISDEQEIKHWPAPFCGVGPRIRAWLKDAETGAMVELPEVQMVQTPYALRSSWDPGNYRVVFAGGEVMACADDVELRQPVTLVGEYGGAQLAVGGTA